MTGQNEKNAGVTNAKESNVGHRRTPTLNAQRNNTFYKHLKYKKEFEMLSQTISALKYDSTHLVCQARGSTSLSKEW